MSFLLEEPKYVVTGNETSREGKLKEDGVKAEAAETEARAFVKMAKERMHAIVDEMFAATPMVQRVRRLRVRR